MKVGRKQVNQLVEINFGVMEVYRARTNNGHLKTREIISDGPSSGIYNAYS